MSAPAALAPESEAPVTPPASGPVHTPWRRTVGLALGAGLAVVVILLAFLWPTVTSSVKDLPIAVTGSPAAVSAVTAQLQKNAGGAFDLTTASSRAEAVKLIETRQVDGAIVLGEKPEVLTASANGAAVTLPEGVAVVELSPESLLMSSSAPRTAAMLADLGYRVVTVYIGEFEKLEGGVTCLSVRVR